MSEVNAEIDEPTDLTNKSVVKAMALLRELGRHPRGITVTELSQRISVTRPTAFRLLLSMEQAGFVDRQDNNYTLGWEIARLGRLADPTAGVAAKVQPILDRVAQEINETVSFALVKSPTEYDLIAEASSSRMLRVSDLYIHRQFPLHASATGKILLSNLDDGGITRYLPETLEAYTRQTITDLQTLLEDIRGVRKNDYSTIDNELEEGLFAVSVPVRDIDGILIGAITATGPDQRMKSGRLPSTVERMRAAASDISTTLG